MERSAFAHLRQRVPADFASYLLPLAGTLVVHARVLGAYFKHDDFVYLYDSVAQPLWELLTLPVGGHFSPVHKGIYLAVHRLLGLCALPCFVAMLGVHLVNVALVHRLVHRVTDRPAIAAIVAAAWGMAPVHHGTLRWFATFSQLLIGTMSLVVLLGVTRGLQTEKLPSRAAVSLWAAVLSLGTITFAAGYVTAIVLPAIAWVLTPAVTGKTRRLLPLAAPVVVAPLVYRFLAWDGIVETGPSLSLLTPVFFGELVAYGLGAIAAGWAVTVAPDDFAHGPFGAVPLSSVLWASAALLVVFIAASVTAFRRSDARIRRLLLAFSSSSIGIYGTIAIGRGGLPLDVEWMATRERYHYAGSIGLVLTVGVVGAVLLPKSFSRSMRAGFVGLLLGLAAGNAWMAPHLDDHTSDANRNAIARVEAALARVVATARPVDGTIYIRNVPFRPLALARALGIGTDRFPATAGVFALLHPDGHIDGTRLRFVEGDAAAVRAVRKQQPIVRDLLVHEIEARRRGVGVFDLYGP